MRGDNASYGMPAAPPQATKIIGSTKIQVTDETGSELLGAIRTRHGDVVGAFAADLLTADGHPFNTAADA